MSTLNADLKSLFIHIMKCGGTSLKESTWNATPNGGGYHDTINDFAEKTDISKCFKWAFVRNPWDRLVSVYHFCPELLAFGSFSDVVEELYINRDALYREPNLRWHHANAEVFGKLNFPRLHVYPQFSCISTNGSLAVDFVGRFENLQSDWEIVCARLGVEATQLPHLRKQELPDYRSFYTPELINKAGDIYWQDAMAFNYCFDS